MEGFDEGFGEADSMPMGESKMPIEQQGGDFFAPAERGLGDQGFDGGGFEDDGGFGAQPDNNGFGDSGGGGFTNDFGGGQPMGDDFAQDAPMGMESQPLGEEFGGGQPMGDGFAQEAPAYSAPMMEDRDNPLTIWREENQRHLSSKADEERANQAKLREEAQEKIAEIQAERQAQVESTQVLNRESQEMAEKNREAHWENVWESVVSLVEMERDKVPEGRRDTSRFRQLLVKLKHTPPAPIGGGIAAN